MKKPRKSPGRALVPSASPPRTPVARRFGERVVTVDAVYHVRAAHPGGPGPWAVEADKVAWRDPATGFDCIIRRSAEKGHLCGFVGVDPGHPLFGFRASALVGLGVLAHGGIDHSERCRGYETEDVSVCHVSIGIAAAGMEDVYESSGHGRHDDRWWFGFSCDKAYDVLPNEGPNYARSELLDGVNHRVYRDEAYVFEECGRLAAQLAAVADGRDPADAVRPLARSPGFDPARVRR